MLRGPGRQWLLHDIGSLCAGSALSGDNTPEANYRALCRPVAFDRSYSTKACGEPRWPVTLGLGVLAANHPQARAAQLPLRIDDRVAAGMRVIV